MFYLGRVGISKEHLQHCTWVVQSLSQEVTCSDLLQWYCVPFKQSLAIITFFKGIQLIRNSSRSSTFNEWLFFHFERAIASTHFSNFFCRAGFVRRRYHNYQLWYLLVSRHVYIVRKSVIWRHRLHLSIFSMVVSLFRGSTWSDVHVKDSVFIYGTCCSHPL